jgi:two-component system response regulator FlrC
VTTISTKAAMEDPALAAWLAGVGLPCRIQDGDVRRDRQEISILHVSEVANATHRDVLIELADGAPVLERARGGMPARLRFGFADMAFGHALIAELLRPAARPACGEPDSAAFLTLATRVAASDATVLVLGETGTGKEGLSRFLHDRSNRRDGAFIAVNCAALPESMLEAILFGHQKGSFTGAGAASEGLFRAADGGTLMLDEIAELPLALQAKLLRAIQEREVLPVGGTRPIAIDVRIVAAANRDLAAEVAAGRFRADLYWRLNVLPLTLKPLGQRRLDIRAIAASLMLRHVRADESFPWPTQSALDRMMAHDWPGNVRELDNVIQRALLLRAGERLDAGDLSLDPVIAAAHANGPILLPEPVSEPVASPVYNAAVARLADVTRNVRAQAIEEALARTGGHRQQTARLLGISERTLRYRLADMRNAA